MTTHTTEQLVDGWLTYQHASDESGIGPENLLSAESEVMDLTYDDPEALWRFIVCAIRDRRSDEVQVREVLAAGPLEDLLTKSGPNFIDRVEAEARTNPRFASLLGGVWQNSMSDDIWDRVRKVWDRRGWDGIPLP